MQQNKFVHAFFGGPIGLPTYELELGLPITKCHKSTPLI